MARKPKAPQTADGELDMTPMIDCVFLLIIFFMLVTELKKMDTVLLSLPDAESAVKDDDVKLIINVEGKGQITVGNKRRDVDELRAFLADKRARLTAEEVSGEWAEILVKIRVDRNAEFRHVQQVLNACIDNKFYKTAFGTLKPND